MAMPANPIYQIPELRPQLWGSAIENYQQPGMSGRWEDVGVQFVPIGCPNVRGVGEDACVQLLWRAPEGFEAPVIFKPFRVEETLQCSTIGGWSPQEINDWAVREARAAFSAALARQVWGGLFQPTNGFLMDGNAHDVTTSDLSPVGALAAVEDALGQRLLGQGMVHVTPGMLVRLQANGGLRFIGDTFYTPSGNIVVADYGYYNTNQQAYIYGSGIVNFVASGIPDSDDQVAVDFAHNQYVAYADGYALAWFEPCPVVKALTNAVTLGTNYGVGIG